MAGSITPFSSRTPDQLARAVERAREDADNAEFRQSVASRLDEYLREYNDRNPELVQQRLNELKSLVGSRVADSLDVKLGGSVAKHTYVDGFSDIDALFVLDESYVGSKFPSQVLHEFAMALRAKVKEGVRVKSGQMAITLEYADGMEIQILPAAQSRDIVRVPSAEGDEWKAIRPRRFTEALTSVNKEMNGKLIPTIKLVKAINANMPKPLRLTGYHIESLAIEAFKAGAEVSKTPGSLLPEFYKRATEIVRAPIVDKTGQSRHVDDYLGAENSEHRQRVSAVLERVHRRIVNANNSTSIRQWEALFGDN